MRSSGPQGLPPRVYAIPILLLSLCISCGGLTEDDTPGVDDIQCDRDPPLTYENFGHGFMTVTCTPCHHSLLPTEERNGAPVGVDLDTYSGVLTWAERVSVRTVDSQTMPPGGGLAEGDLSLLEEWLACSVAQDLATLSGENTSEIMP